MFVVNQHHYFLDTYNTDVEEDLFRDFYRISHLFSGYPMCGCVVIIQFSLIFVKSLTNLALSSLIGSMHLPYMSITICHIAQDFSTCDTGESFINHDQTIIIQINTYYKQTIKVSTRSNILKNQPNRLIFEGVMAKNSFFVKLTVARLALKIKYWTLNFSFWTSKLSSFFFIKSLSNPVEFFHNFYFCPQCFFLIVWL